MVSVALIGPDGAGKTTIGRLVESRLPMPAKYIYMGVNLESSNILLPTSRLWRLLRPRLGKVPDQGGPRDLDAESRRSKGLLSGLAAGCKSSVAISHRMADEWYRQGAAWYYKRRGWVVVFDRHYFSDYYAYDIAPRVTDASTSPRRPSFGRRLHGMMLNRIFPKPDLVIYLDAPGEVLLARKGEGTLELLERRRGDYLKLRDLVAHFVLVDASRPTDQVAEEVVYRILDFCRTKRPTGLRGSRRGQDARQAVGAGH